MNDKQRGKEEISITWASFSKSFCFSIVFVALYLPSNSVSTRTGEGTAEQKADKPGQWEGGG